jgi:hypothetical protein
MVRWYTRDAGNEITLKGASTLARTTSAGDALSVKPGTRLLVAGESGFAWSGRPAQRGRARSHGPVAWWYNPASPLVVVGGLAVVARWVVGRVTGWWVDVHLRATAPPTSTRC